MIMLTLAKLLFLTPFIAEMTPELNELEIVTCISSEEKTIFLKEMGLSSWQFWMQKNDDQIFFLHFLEGPMADKPEFVATRFQLLVDERQTCAVHLQNLFPAISDSIKKVEKVLELDFSEEEPASQFPCCFFYPLLPGKVKDHREYCRQAMNEKKEQTRQACRDFGISHLSKWIQKKDQSDYVLYYQKLVLSIDVCREHFLSLKSNLKAQAATQSLREQTGLSFEELFPVSEFIGEMKIN